VIEWSLWARLALGVRGRRLVVPRTDRTQFPRDAFPSPEDVKVAAPAMLLALLEAPESVAMSGLPYAFCGWVWIGRSTEDHHPFDPNRRPFTVRLDGPVIWTAVQKALWSFDDPLMLNQGSSEFRERARPVARREIDALLDVGWGDHV